MKTKPNAPEEAHQAPNLPAPDWEICYGSGRDPERVHVIDEDPEFGREQPIPFNPDLGLQAAAPEPGIL